MEFEQRKAEGSLPDPRKIPLIATKNYSKLLSVGQPSVSKSTSAAVSPGGGGGKACRRCQQYLGTAEQKDLCSTCYRQSEGLEEQSEPCRNCHEYRGTKERHYYCSSCYSKFLAGEISNDKQQKNNSAVSGK